ncbi:MAG: Stk1 family PASTA domain-containing Ser/Thr kinase [Lachnospiraceae bacterium]|nr:Stk1 family PASTA domain-containing Ser/Thr kinase [Lachnospiraceae bacterium]
MILPIGMCLGDRYELIEIIGKGGMAIVYRARDKKLERFVTVKVLRDEYTSDEEFKARFKVEARAAASLSHVNIVNVYDVGQEDDIYYIVMEYVHGDSLKQAIIEKAPFDNITILSIAIQIASALSHAHKNHIIHKDIKPQNILVSFDGTIKVTDFGIAKAPSTTTLAQEGAVGSVHYLSPEQARGGYVDERSDIYSLGITMFEMATGRLPFEGDNSVSVALMHINQKLPDIKEFNPEISREIQGMISKATRKRADERYANIDLLLEDLKRALSEASEGFIKGNAAGEALGPVLSEAPKQKEIPEKPAEVYSAKYQKGNDDKTTENEDIQEIDIPNFDKPKKQSQNGYQPQGKRVNDIREPLNERQNRSVNMKPSSRQQKEYDEEVQLEKKVTIAAVITALVIIFTISFVGMKFIKEGILGGSTEAVATVENMPNFVGMSYEDAVKEAEALGLSLERDGDDYSLVYEEGIVILQSVEANTLIGDTKEVTVAVSLGIKSYDMINFIGQDEEKAVSKLESLGVTDISTEYEYTTEAELGKIISQQPTSGVKIDKNTKVIFVTSKGAEPEQVTVPDLTGKTESEAKSLITNSGFIFGQTYKKSSDTVDEGLVISQTLEKGTKVAKDSVLSIVVSTGKDESAEETSGTLENTDSSDTSSQTLTVSVPMGAEIADEITIDIVKITNGGAPETVFSGVKQKSELPFDVQISGEGNVEVQVYFDGALQWTENFEFPEGGN